MGTCRCKMCGGQIHYDNDASVAVCEYCNSEQTIVKTNDVKQLKLFSRANTLRLQNEFDKAQTTYENILIDEPNSAEAHWGICLCRYGIEYINDDKTSKKIPTCHRTVYKNIFDDLDYNETLKNADVIAKAVYEKEAKQIDKIQKEILKISQKEDPYDIFICYKETDDNGDRTPDSVIAQNIYDELTKTGYKVFFSRISLESKIGTNYEPVIFAALMSSKVMLAIGSCPEYYNSPWVKNEWGRFLSFMNDTHGKHLIPCFFNMDAYELPEEFLMLQAQDIGKIGYMQDLVRGIKKLISVGSKNEVVQNVEIVLSKQDESRLESIFRRVKIYIEDQEFEKANEILEEVLNIKSDFAEAYFCKVLIDLKARNEEDLLNNGYIIDEHKDFKRALKFADSEYREHLTDLSLKIKKSSDVLEKAKKYNKAVNLFEWKKYPEALGIFNSIYPFRESNEYIEKCSREIYTDAMYYYNKKNAQDLETAANLFYLILDYKDSDVKYKTAHKKSIEYRVDDACKKMEDSMKRISDNNFANYEKERVVCNQCLTELEHLAKLTDSKDIMYKANKYRDQFNAMVAKRNRDVKIRNVFIVIVLVAILVIGIIAAATHSN